MLHSEITHHLNRAPAALAALHSDIAQLINAQQGVTSMTKRTGHKNACGHACQKNETTQHSRLTTARALRNAEAVLVHYAICTLQVSKRVFHLRNIPDGLRNVLAWQRVIVGTAVVPNVPRIHLGREKYWSS